MSQCNEFLMQSTGKRKTLKAKRKELAKLTQEFGDPETLKQVQPAAKPALHVNSATSMTDVREQLACYTLAYEQRAMVGRSNSALVVFSWPRCRMLEVTRFDVEEH